jgi:hypothetical protein
MKKIKYDCVENENYITFVMEGETLEEIEIGTHSAPFQGRTVIGAKDLKNALEFIDYQDVEKSATTEGVQEAIEYLQPLTEHSVMSGNFVKHLKTAITALQAYQPWIPVSERLPDDGYCLACCSTGNRETTFFWRGRSRELEELGYVVTHWKPLPKPPKGE